MMTHVSFGAAVTIIVALLGGNIWVQLFTFIIVSTVILLTVRPIATRHFNNHIKKTNIDAVVGKLPEIEECAAFSYPDERLGEIVALAVVAKEGMEINLRALRNYCARNLADFQQPHKFFIVDKLPRNAMGKLQRMAILDYIR